MSIKGYKYQNMNFKEWPRVSEQEPPLKKCETDVEVFLKNVIWTQIYYVRPKPWTQTRALPFSHFANNEAENLKIYNITVF